MRVEIWKRKNPDEYYAWLQKNPDKDIRGHSRYHRPYQADMLRCTAKRKVFRIGRQCLASSTKVQLRDGTTKSIKDIKVGDQVLSLKEEVNTQTYSKVIDHWSSGTKKIYKIKTKFGHVIECSDNHPFLILNKNTNRFRKIIDEGPDKEWKSISDGLSVGNKIAVPTIIKNLKNNESVGDLAPFLGYFLSDGSASIRQSAKFTNINIDYLIEFE